MPQTSERIKGFGESVIRRMTRIANQHGAINLSQGFPDFDPPAAIIEAGQQVMRDGPHQYAVTWGAPDFRGLWRSSNAASWGWISTRPAYRRHLWQHRSHDGRHADGL